MGLKMSQQKKRQTNSKEITSPVQVLNINIS